MAGRLSSMVSIITGGNGVFNRSVRSSLRLRSDMDLPVGKHIVPNRPLTVNNDEHIDRIADTIGKYLTLAWLSGGLSSFVGLGSLAVGVLQNTVLP